MRVRDEGRDFVSLVTEDPAGSTHYLQEDAATRPTRRNAWLSPLPGAVTMREAVAMEAGGTGACLELL